MVVVKNLMAILITITKGIKVAQVVGVNVVPPVELAPRTLEELDEVQGIQQTKMLVERRKEVLLKQLDLSGLDGWSKANQAATHTLLADYHDHGIFSLEPGELGCTDLAEHEIRVVDDKPFKEQFERIPPPMVDEVYAHLKEMLEVGTICSSQSLWCNAVVWVHKKDRGLFFVLTFISSMPEPRKTPIHFPRYRKPLKA